MIEHFRWNISADERELAFRTTGDWQDRRDLISSHPLQTVRPISKRTPHKRLVELEILDVEKGGYGATMLRRGPDWIVFEEGPHGKELRYRELGWHVELDAELRRLMERVLKQSHASRPGIGPYIRFNGCANVVGFPGSSCRRPARGGAVYP